MWASPETLEAMALHRQNNFPAGGMGLACRAGSATVPLYAAPAAAQAQPIMPPLTDSMRAVLRNENDVYGDEDALYAALCDAAQAQPVVNQSLTTDEVTNALARMDALLDPASGLLTVPDTSATVAASRADLALIRAALAQQPSGLDESLADTQRAIIEAAERRGYERGVADGAQDQEDAQRYRWLKANVGGGYELPGGYYIPDEDTDSWDKTIDAARAAKGADQ